MRILVLLCGLVAAHGASVGRPVQLPSYPEPQNPIELPGAAPPEPFKVSGEKKDGKCVCKLDVHGFLSGLRGPVAARLDSQTIRINRLTARLQKLSDDIEHHVAEADDAMAKSKGLDARVSKLEGTGCSHSQFQCGGDNPQCIDDLSVCNGVQDCDNGADESSCDIGANVGSVWKGYRVFDDCSQRQPETMTVVVNSVTKQPFFPQRPVVGASLIMKLDNEDEERSDVLNLSGSWNPAAKSLTFGAPEADGLGIMLTFAGYDKDHAEGYIVRELRGEKCARFSFHRQ